MQTLVEIIEAAKKASGFDQDQQLARKIGVPNPYVSGWRHGTRAPDSYAMMQLQKILGIDARELLAIIEAERAKDEERRNYWENIKKEFRNKITITLALFVICLMFGTPETAKASDGLENISFCALTSEMYIMLSKLLRKWNRRNFDLPRFALNPA